MATAAAVNGLDWTVPEVAIVARLKAELAEGPAALLKGGVLAATELAAVKVESQKVPAVYVVYAGMRVVAPDAEAAARVAYAHSWIVAVAVSQVRPGAGVAERHASAAPILLRVGQLLHGWVPAAGFSALRPRTPPAPIYDELGFAYLPQVFETSAVSVAQGGMSRPR